MSVILSVVLLTLCAPIAYVGYVVYKKGINIKEVRINSVDDAKRLLTPPRTDRPIKYLQKAA
ncbi:PREDICTED: uncharacterized protein LOC108361623 [Rhagoletis zephyria]|uniref:uncharacterized protein LOC108361623 n=1 Tax=Rhagoletis zephyria TaxID=28612 RepID=UPI00081141BD|nr:PREDICTED: uncharacterized protein LOC108361623 [Rhagoletis zephyria]XP_036331171.1 uncharacterized protein LOC118742871 [Rhagoletis pomonella]